MYLSNEAAVVVAAANLSKSERIRRLKQQGMRQTDIARALGISDQFVANVVGRMRPSANSQTAMQQASDPVQVRTQIAEGGRLVIPASFRAALGVDTGDTLLLRLEDGEIRVLTANTALRRSQQLLRPFLPEGRSLVDELVAERRAAAERE
jgi:AbrB family looped-hinge helix DNA binding protein